MGKPKKQSSPNAIAQNRKARFDYHLEQFFEAGLSLQGWEVKALREGKGNLTESYVMLKEGEAFLFGARIEPLPTASTHSVPDPQRTRKLLLHTSEISKIYVATQQKGYTCVATALYWKGQRVKCEVALAKGKKQHDKRADVKAREWSRQKERILKSAG